MKTGQLIKPRKLFVAAIITLLSLMMITVETNSQTTQKNSGADATGQVRELLQGTWYSSDWEYGFHIAERTGTITDWNNTYNPQDKNGKGDVVLNIQGYSASGFTAKHLFYDGSWIDVTAIIIDKNTIQLSGRKEIWVMTRQK